MNISSVIQLHQQGQFDLAEKQYKKFLKNDKNNIDILFLLGLLYIQTKKINNAIIQFEKVLTFEPNHLPSLYNLSIAYIEIDKSKFAIKNLNKCIDLDNNNYKSYQARADAHVKNGNFLDAKSDIEKSIKINPLDYVNYVKRAYIYEHEGKYLEAINDLKKALVSESNLDQINFSIGNNFAKNNNHKEAINYYLSAIDQNNCKPEFYLNLANSYAAIKEFSDAIINYQKAYSLDYKLEYLRSSYLSIVLTTCSWDEFDKIAYSYIQDLQNGIEIPISPIECLTYIDDIEIQRKN